MATAPPKASTEPAVEKTPPTLKRDRGTVKSVLSGDTLVVLDDKPSPNGPPAEKIITLSSLLAPKLARGDNKEEPFAWESREFLRKKVVGKKIQYAIDHAAANREYVTVYLAPVAGGEPECLNHTVVSEGWATVHNKDPKRVEHLMQLEDAANQAGKGIHSKDKPKPLGKNDEDADTLFRQLKGKPINAVVEQVRTGSSVRVTVLPSRHQFQILLSGVQAPGWKKKEGESEPQPEPFAREAKFFVENHVLQRDVTLTIEGIAPGAAGSEKSGVAFTGSIEFQSHDVAEELLKAGLAKYAAHSAALRGVDWVAKLKAAEKAAKDAQRRLFAGYAAKENGGQKGGLPSEFHAKVVNIQNSGAITVIPEGQTAEVQINISSIKVPRPGFPGEQEDPKDNERKAEKHWAAEGKEALRKRLIGQKVRIVFDYTREAKAATSTTPAFPEKSYYTVYQGDQNIAVVLVESGLATVMQYKSGEDRTVDYEVLIMAESKAKASKKGLHSPADKVPIRRYTDLCVDNDPKSDKRAAQITRAKAFASSLERAGPLKAVIDYVFSGARFKVVVPKQNAIFMFALSGVRVPKRDEGADAAVLSDEALKFSREKLNQLEVTLNVDGMDKGGNFVGSLFVGKKNFAVNLLENGYAYIHYPSAERLKEFKDLQTAEDSAKSKKLNHWKNYDEEAEKAKLAAAAAESGEAIGPIQGNTVEVIVTEVVDGSRLQVQIAGPESAGLDELVNQLTELSVSEGSMPPITPKVGELVRGLFSEDGRWYRAKVTERIGDKYKLLYVDYGNTEVVPATSLRTLPANSDLKALPAQAHSAALAFVKPLKEDNDYYKEAREALRDLAGGRKLQATVEFKDANGIHLTLIDPSDNLNITLEMVQQGLARLERSRKRHMSNPSYMALREAEDRAKQRRIGIWYYGDIPDSDEDERETPRKAAPGAKDAKGGAAAAAAAGGKKK